ncbi:hypothetical protein ACFZBU_40090 [Embleya sp. NPDC008237]|uniref:hypothetical protein n=1 Tax=Embleya sp. NPDC008237 TaxID=3363978 RepID=UPI0036E7BCFC
MTNVQVVGGCARLCRPEDVPGFMAADVDVIYACGHSFRSEDDGPVDAFLGTRLADLAGVNAPALILDTCRSATREFLAGIASVRDASLPPATVLACTDIAPFAHEPLFAPLLEALVRDGRPTAWQERLQTALTQTLASAELEPHARREWGRWVPKQVPGTA